MTAQQAIASINQTDEPDRIALQIETEKRRSVLEALMKSR